VDYLNKQKKNIYIFEELIRLTLTLSPSRRVSSNSTPGVNSYDAVFSVDSLLSDHLPPFSVMINFGLTNFAD
jgi:hypothetical protein